LDFLLRNSEYNNTKRFKIQLQDKGPGKKFKKFYILLAFFASGDPLARETLFEKTAPLDPRNFRKSFLLFIF